MTRRAAYRGQPLLVLLMLLASWLGARTVLWEGPFPEALAASAERLSRPFAADVPNKPFVSGRQTPAQALARADASPSAAWFEAAPASATATPQGWTFTELPLLPAPAAPPPQGSALPLLVAAFPQLAGDTTRAPDRRWSGDAWLLLRRDTTTPITSGRGSYGQSQVGAVLRYRLAPRSGHRPAAYLRATSALAGERDMELAAGLTARPLSGVPFALAAEVRGAHTAEGTEARPAAFAYTELAPFKLPLDARAEVYLQGGWVGGRFETPFVDGQARVDRKVVRLGPAELRAGAGLWGGAQKGAKRLDVGPGATIALELGGAPVRMSADWRFRVAGEAHPHSGPALTVSTGF